MPTGNVNKARRKADPNCATALRFEQDRMVVGLGDGRELSVPLKHYPTLWSASSAQREGWELLGDGRGIHWESLDLDLSVDGLLQGLPERIPRPPAERPSRIAAPSVASGRRKSPRVG
jgi:hypothetical protein